MPSSHLVLCHPSSSCPQSFPSSGSFPMSSFFASGGQSIGASASASILPMNIQGWFPLGWTDLISLQTKGLSRVFSSSTVRKHEFFGTQHFLWSNSHICMWLLEKKNRGFPASSDCKSVCLQCGRPEFYLWVRKITWRRKWQPTPVLLPGKFLDGGAGGLQSMGSQIQSSGTWLSDFTFFHWKKHRFNYTDLFSKVIWVMVLNSTKTHWITFRKYC